LGVKILFNPFSPCWDSNFSTREISIMSVPIPVIIVIPLFDIKITKINPYCNGIFGMNTTIETVLKLPGTPYSFLCIKMNVWEKQGLLPHKRNKNICERSI